MSDHRHHHHHHEDGATRFKEHSLNAIVLRHRIEKWLKILLCIVALVMVVVVIYIYSIG